MKLNNWHWTLAIIVMMATGFVIVLVGTRWGVGASPDSVVYLGVAQNLLAGRGLSVPFGIMIDSPLTHYPPLYPLILSISGLWGGEPAEAARWLGASLFGLNIGLVAFVIHKSTNSMTPWMPLVGAWLMLVSGSMLAQHVMAWSEPLFIGLGLAGLFVLAQYLEKASWKYLLAASGLLGLACLTRYAGVALLGAGGAAILLLKPGSWRSRVGATLLLGLVGLLPSLWWAVRNLSVAGTTANRTILFHPLQEVHLWQALDTVSAWLLVPNLAPSYLKFSAVFVGLLGLLAVMYWRPGLTRLNGLAWLVTPLRRTTKMAQLLIIVGGTYIIFLIGSITWVDANTPLDERILSPLYVVGLILLVEFLGEMLKAASKLTQQLLLLSVIVFSVASVYSSVLILSNSYHFGIGFNTVAWQTSDLVTWVRAFPPDSLIYSNAPEIVYLRTDRSALLFPKKFESMTQQVNEEYLANLAAMQARLEAQQGIIVYFSALPRLTLPSANDLQRVLPLEVVAEASDGTILVIGHGK